MLEVWIESQLRILYPRTTILPNDRTAIGKELDLYFPKHELAFEINGIFHYEPIFGSRRLYKMQSNDGEKVRLCTQKGITLNVVDVSRVLKFSVENAQPYLDHVAKIVGQFESP